MLVASLLILNGYLGSATGQLVEEVRPTCSNGTAVYRCTGGMNGLLMWSISGARDAFQFQRFATPEGFVRRETISSTPVVFTVIETTPSSISVTLTILEPVPLNGARMECSGDMLQIVTPSSKDLPVALHFFFNISTINVFISPKRNDIYYSFENQFNVTREITFPITLPYNIINLNFFHCEGPTVNTEMVTFNIGICIYEDRSVDRSYTLFTNGNWTISQACGDLNVTTSYIMCNNSNRRWDQDVQCPVSVTANPTNIEEDAFTTSQSNTCTCDPDTNDKTVGSTCSPTERGEITVSVFIGSIIGIYALGILMGTLIGVGLMKLLFKYQKKVDIFNDEINSSKKDIIRTQNDATCYEEIVLADDSSGINLSQNVAYGEVKKH